MARSLDQGSAHLLGTSNSKAALPVKREGPGTVEASSRHHDPLPLKPPRGCGCMLDKQPSEASPAIIRDQPEILDPGQRGIARIDFGKSRVETVDEQDVHTDLPVVDDGANLVVGMQHPPSPVVLAANLHV